MWRWNAIGMNELKPRPSWIAVERGVHRGRAAERGAEEVETRHRDARLGHVVVEDLHVQRPHDFGRRAGEGHPDVADRGRPVDIGDRDGFARFDDPLGHALAAVGDLAARAAFTGDVLEA